MIQTIRGKLLFWGGKDFDIHHLVMLLLERFPQINTTTFFSSSRIFHAGDPTGWPKLPPSNSSTLGDTSTSHYILHVAVPQDAPKRVVSTAGESYCANQKAPCNNLACGKMSLCVLQQM